MFPEGCKGDPLFRGIFMNSTKQTYFMLIFGLTLTRLTHVEKITMDVDAPLPAATGHVGVGATD